MIFFHSTDNVIRCYADLSSYFQTISHNGAALTSAGGGAGPVILSQTISRRDVVPVTAENETFDKCIAKQEETVTMVSPSRH